MSAVMYHLTIIICQERSRICVEYETYEIEQRAQKLVRLLYSEQAHEALDLTSQERLHSLQVAHLFVCLLLYITKTLTNIQTNRNPLLFQIS